MNNEQSNNESKISSYICSHYYWCYFQIHVTGEDIKHLFDNNVGILGHMKAYYGCYEWKKKWQLTYPYIIMLKQLFESQHIHTNIA
jgi:hypothetical protein